MFLTNPLLGIVAPRQARIVDGYFISLASLDVTPPPMLILRNEKGRLQLRTNIPMDARRSHRAGRSSPLHPWLRMDRKVMEKDGGEDLNPDQQFIGGPFAPARLSRSLSPPPPPPSPSAPGVL